MTSVVGGSIERLSQTLHLIEEKETPEAHFYLLMQPNERAALQRLEDILSQSQRLNWQRLEVLSFALS